MASWCRAGLTAAVVAAVMAGGCTTPKPPALEPGSLWDRVRNGTTPGLVLQTALVDRPAGDEYLTTGLWATAGRPLPHQLAALLGHNGIRVGVLTGVIPGEFAAVMTVDAELLAPTNRTFTAGRPRVVPVSGPAAAVSVTATADLAADPVPVELTNAECGLQITAGPTAADRVKLVCEVQVQHGDKQALLALSPDAGGFTRQEKKPLKAFPALTFEVVLGPDDYLVVGPTDAPAGKLGGAFFLASDPVRARQRLLVIRAGRAGGAAGGRSG